MTKFLSGLVLGFLMYGVLAGVHSYYWWSIEESSTCRSMPIDKCLQYIEKEMGVVRYLKYVLIVPTFEFQEWRLK